MTSTSGNASPTAIWVAEARVAKAEWAAAVADWTADWTMEAVWGENVVGEVSVLGMGGEQEGAGCGLPIFCED